MTCSTLDSGQGPQQSAPDSCDDEAQINMQDVNIAPPARFECGSGGLSGLPAFFGCNVDSDHV